VVENFLHRLKRIVSNGVEFFELMPSTRLLSMNVNLKGKEDHTYDAIVVGSGITGGWAAKELCENGLKVLMVERGKPVEHPNYPTATKDPWDFTYRKLTQEDKARSPIQARHWSFKHDNKHFYINDLENPYEERKRFDWVRGDVLGGRSLLWSRQCLRWSDLDFEANLKDGHGIDWPIRYKDIAPWYDYVEKFIGVSGQAEGLAQLPDGIFQPPFEMNCVEKHFKQKIESKFPDRRVTMNRMANATAPVKGRGLCQSRNLCSRGCPYGGYFSTNSSTLPAALATGNLTVKTNTLVNKVLYDVQKGVATGVEVVDTETNTVAEYFSRVIFLNAATVATTFILLNSTSSRFPTGLGNGSDQVGRNLTDHHKCTGISATIEGFEDKYYSGRTPSGIQIPRYQNMKEKNDFLRGYNFQGNASRANWTRVENHFQIGAELKEAVQTPGPWTIGFTGFGETLPNSDNRVTLNTDLKDKWNRNTVSIDCEFGENEKAMQKHMVSSIQEMLEVAGFKDIRIEGNMSHPGNANHEMGTARMGKDPKTSVLNSFNQMHEVKNVFITDGSFMTSASSVNPSLTYMAMTARACNYAIDQLKKRNI
jgi:choline dehydrogenase-like flavoprotein